MTYLFRFKLSRLAIKVILNKPMKKLQHRHSGTLLNGDVFVISKSSYKAVCKQYHP